MINTLKKLHKTVYINTIQIRKAPKNGMPKLNLKRLVNGNEKLDKSILIFDLLAGTELKVCNQNCFKCYAIQSQKQYIYSYMFRYMNTVLAKTNTTILSDLIISQIKSAKSKNVIRIHSSGDFFSQEYINMWDGIIKEFPMKKFYAYTKRLNDFDYTSIQSNKNFNLINSVVSLDGQTVYNYGDIDHIKMLSENGYFVCPATKHNWKGMCGKDCNFCVTNKMVCFNIHYSGQSRKK